MTTILFENYYTNQPISSLEAERLNDFTKVFIVGEIVRKKEEYNKKTLTNIVYYKSNDEDDHDIIKAIQSEYKYVPFEIIEKQKIENYTIEKGRAFTHAGIYDRYKFINLFDSNNRKVFEKTESNFKGEEKIDIRKYHYTKNGFEKEFLYDKNGELSAISGDSADQQWYTKEEFLHLFDPKFLFKNPYYKNAEMLPQKVV